MQLADGLAKYQSYCVPTAPLESAARIVLDAIGEHGDNPTPNALAAAKRFIVDVEKWKADCLQDRIGNAALNTEITVWHALRGAANAGSDEEALLSVMQLRGFGSSVDEETGQRRAKVATAILRFLWPEAWGVVDWRVAAVLSLLDKHRWNVDAALAEAKNHKAQELREAFDLLNERAAADMNRRYRRTSEEHPNVLPRAADVDMALFGLSLLVWPMK
jgi:hypothetical protein